MLEFQQILNGIDGHAGKLPSIISPCHPSPLLPFVLAAVQPCSVAFRIHHVTFILPGIEAIFINGVPEGALILADQSQTSVLLARHGPGGVGSSAELERRRGRCPLAPRRRAQTKKNVSIVSVARSAGSVSS